MTIATTPQITKKWLANRFAAHIGNEGINKSPIEVLQINLGRKCNLACAHCHVEASPLRTEDLSNQTKEQILTILERFKHQIKTVDLTGGAPEMHNGFREIVEAARKYDIDVIVRTNLTIFFVEGYEDLPDFFAKHQVHAVASLPCYLEDNVDTMRGSGVFRDSIKALQALNKKGYGSEKLKIDLVYNPPIPKDNNFNKTADQNILEKAYKEYLLEHFDITFNSLYTITNLPIGRFKMYLFRRGFYTDYLDFLERIYNVSTLPFLMCKNQLSIDYNGKIYDCDFNQMEDVQARDKTGKTLTLNDIIEQNSLDIIKKVQLRNFCYGCTAGAGSSCGGSLT